MLDHPARVRSAILAGLGINMVRGMVGTGPLAKALEARSIDEVTNGSARTSGRSPNIPEATSQHLPPAWRVPPIARSSLPATT